MRAFLLESPELDAYGQMALDEALLREGSADALTLRFYRWPGGNLGRAPAALAIPESLRGRSPSGLDRGPEPVPKAVTFGYFQPCAEAVGHVRGRGLSIVFPIVRRPTGGGIVYHDGDVTFSIVFPWARLIAPSWIYKDLHRAIHLGLKARALPSRLWSPPPTLAPFPTRAGDGRTPPSTPLGGASGSAPAGVCFSGPSPMDLVHEDGVKCLGGALRRSRGTGLYQGSLRPEGFKPASREQLVQAIAEGLALQWKTIFVPRAASPDILREADRLRTERYVTDGWNKRR